MASLRRLAWLCRNLAKQHVDNPDVPAASDDTEGYAERVQTAMILFHVELEKSLRETEDYLNEMPPEFDRQWPGIGSSSRHLLGSCRVCPSHFCLDRLHHR
jgi:hypothetical protein